MVLYYETEGKSKNRLFKSDNVKIESAFDGIKELDGLPGR